MTGPRRWRLGGAVVVGGLVAVMTLLLAGPSGASTMPLETTTTYANAPGGIPSMLPKPDTGVAPRDADDRGGWAQYAVFYGILASGVIIFGLVMLESRRKLRAIREAEGAGPAAGSQSDAESTRSDPVAETSVN